jgi:hypothetical protein
MQTQSSAREANRRRGQGDESPHACNDGWVTIGQLVVDEETGEEAEE